MATAEEDILGWGRERLKFLAGERGNLRNLRASSVAKVLHSEIVKSIGDTAIHDSFGRFRAKM